MKTFLGGETEYVKDWVTNGSVVFNIGAHIGSFTCWALDRGATVYALEPYIPSCLQLQQNTASYPDCQILNAALGPTLGSCSLRLTDDEPSSAYVIDGSDITMLDWPTLREAWSVPIDVLKVDIEGTEYDVFTTADLSDVKHFVIEVHDWTQIGSTPRPGVGHRDAPSRPSDVYEKLLDHLERTHHLSVYGDSTGGHIVGTLR